MNQKNSAAFRWYEDSTMKSVAVATDQADPDADDQLRRLPESWEAATAEAHLLRGDITNIAAAVAEMSRMAPLGPAHDGWFEYRDRRKAALSARHWKEVRLAFLKAWLAANPELQPQKKRTSRKYPEADATVLALRTINLRLGRLENLYEASRAYLEEDTDETHAAWTEAVDALKGEG